MKIIQFIHGISIIVIGILSFFVWKIFAKEISKYSFVKYGKPQEIGIRICFYLVGTVAIVAGIVLLIRYFKS